MRRLFLNRIRSWPGLVYVVIIFAALCLEVFVFNSQSFALIGKNAPQIVFLSGDFILTGFDVNPGDSSRMQPNESTDHLIELTGIDQNVLTLYLPVNNQVSTLMQCKIYATDAASSDYYRVLDETWLSSQIVRSQYIRLHLDGASEKVKIVFLLKDGQDFNLPEIVINKPIPISISWLRVGLLVVLGFLAVFLRRAAVCKKLRDPADPYQRQLLGLSVFYVILIGFFLAAIAAGNKLYVLKAVSGDLYSRDLTDALLNGQLHLLVTPPDALASLANPYDSLQRATSKISGILWDAAYYQGNYYVYFGIVPVLFLFIPFHLLTGLYLTSAWAVIIFSAAAAAGLVRLMDGILTHYFPNLPFRFYLIGSFVLAAGSNIWWCLSRPKFYEAAITAGLCCVVWGIALLFQCWHDVQTNTLRLGRLAAGCLLMALAVGCRPNLLLVSFLVLPILWKILRQTGIGNSLRLKRGLAIAIPYFAVGSCLAVYNYLRFGSICEFGASYQLTVADMTERNSFHLAKIIPGLWYYLFNPPNIDLIFPFVHFPSGRIVSYSGYLYSDKRCLGLLAALPICWFLLSWPWLRPILKRYYQGICRLTAGLTGTALILIILDSMFGGAAGRYLTDFSWMFVLAAIIFAAAWTEQSQRNAALDLSGPKKAPVISVFGAAAILTVFVVLLVAIQGENDLLSRNNPILYRGLERLLAFWLP